MATPKTKPRSLLDSDLLAINQVVEAAGLTCILIVLDPGTDEYSIVSPVDTADTLDALEAVLDNARQAISPIARAIPRLALARFLVLLVGRLAPSEDMGRARRPPPG